RELRRVVRPEGQILLLEHVRPPGLGGAIADFLNPLAVRLIGANINRKTVENVEQAGLTAGPADGPCKRVMKPIIAPPARRHGIFPFERRKGRAWRRSSSSTTSAI